MNLQTTIQGRESQGSYMRGIDSNSRTFKAMYQQIQGLNTEEKVSVKSDVQLFKMQL